MSDSSTLQPELPSGEGLNQNPLPDGKAANEPSDDLFGDEPSESTKPVESKARVATSTEQQPAAIPDSVDQRPTSEPAPVAENASGIAPVAQSVPSEAKLDQPPVSPSEPLATGEVSVDKDTQMNDAPPQAAASELTDSARPSKSEAQIAEGISSATAPEKSVPTPPAEKPEMPDDKPTVAEVKTDESETASKPLEEVSAATTAPDSTAPKVAELADQPMMDTPSSGTVRPRDEVDGDDEPAAKRARTEEPAKDASVPATEPAVKEQAAPATAAPTPAPAAATTNGTGAHPSAPAAPAAAPAPTAVAPPAAAALAPSTTHFSNEPMKPTQKAVLSEKIKNTKKVKSAAFFTKPVDPVAQNIPHYTTIITQPMDLGTMERKLKADVYSSVDDFVADFELMITNCITFNGPQHPVAVAGQNLRAYFLKQMETVPVGSSASVAPPKPKKASPKPPSARRESRTHAVPGAARSPVEPSNTYALLPGGTPMIRRDDSAGRPKRDIIKPQRDLPYTAPKPKRKENQIALKFCEHILDEFKKPRNIKLTSAFLVPVDPVALNIPNYFSVVKRPMDLQTMTNKLKTGQYGTAVEFKDDFVLMLDNCFAFNPPGNPVHEQGKELRAAFEREWSKKELWVKKNTPQSQRASPASDAESDGEESDAEEEGGEIDSNEATIAMLRKQLETMQNTIASISGAKPAKSSSSGNKKKKSTSTSSKPVKKSSVSAPKPTIKPKPKKQRQVTYEEKQEISSATENMNDDQIAKLTNIITENVAKYKDMDAEDVELEIDDLPNDVQHKLLRYVRSLFPPKPESDDGNAIDDDYEPERPAARSGKKKHKPMKKHEQESRIKELQEQMSRLQGGLSGNQKAAAPAVQAKKDSSDEEDSESSEEE
ncbi:hypothetical protein AAFC00_006439 [Neodothiora populina]|uniref:Bromodomain-containing protein n=1 Tax=Neodothiora populina TaxID=2781224 RepID=A0ABR3P5E5_9PEZI